MNKQQQKLYDKLLKKVNEFCLGQAAEDVIECIDALVDTYEVPKKRIAKTKRQLLEENETYQHLFHEIRYYVESKEFTLDLLAKTLESLNIIKKHKLLNYVLKNPKCAAMYHLSEEECNLLKGVLK